MKRNLTVQRDPTRETEQVELKKQWRWEGLAVAN